MKTFCDIIHIEVGHILLYMSWKYDHKSIHDGFTNKITITHKEGK